MKLLSALLSVVAQCQEGFATTSNHIPLGSQCTAAARSMDKIVGGVTAAKSAYPWQVRLDIHDHLYDNDPWQCGGSIIHDNWILIRVLHHFWRVELVSLESLFF